jgi:regulatory protein
LTGLHDKARQYAFKLLSYRGRSEKELESRLRKKGFTKTVASSTIGYLKQTGLIDDKALAETLKREALTTKLLSQSGAKRFMLTKGIPRDVVDSIFSNDKNEDFENASKLADKKLKVLKNYSSDTARRRLYNFLFRRGYSTDTIISVLKNKTFKEG